MPDLARPPRAMTQSRRTVSFAIVVPWWPSLGPRAVTRRLGTTNTSPGGDRWSNFQGRRGDEIMASWVWEGSPPG
eukprot:6194687-Pyramimonas_sp.AAC.1